VVRKLLLHSINSRFSGRIRIIFKQLATVRAMARILNSNLYASNPRPEPDAPMTEPPSSQASLEVPARPRPLRLTPASTALIVIDMQRDFLEPGGFGAMLGNDVTLLRSAVAPCRALLDAARRLGLLVIHTREGHRPDLTDVPPAKLNRGRGTRRIGDPGPMGRILIRGEPGHDIIPELAPIPGEPVLDKPGKGAFYQTDLTLILANRGIRTLLVAGVTTEVCVHTTVREANDRGYECLVVSDAVASYFPEFHRVALEMICAQGGIFGWVADSAALCAALRRAAT
jgi:biuret amidohydrolase